MYVAQIYPRAQMTILWWNYSSKSVQFSRSVVSDSSYPMNHRSPGLPVHHQLPEFTQTHVHRVGDAIQPSHPLSSPFPPARNPSQHQSFPMSQLFAWGGQSTGVSAVKCIPISEMLTVKESMLVSYCFSLWRLQELTWWTESGWGQWWVRTRGLWISK